MASSSVRASTPREAASLPGISQEYDAVDEWKLQRKSLDLSTVSTSAH